MGSDPGRSFRPVSGGPLDLREPAAEGPFDIDETHRYRDGGALGRGGMGEVRSMHDRRLDRDVALKLTHLPDDAAEARMLREATLTARLEHPGIVPVYGAGRLPDGRAFYTMRVIRGRSLSAAVAATPTLAGRLRLVRHFMDACEAIAYAHSQGVLHRDLKPANIMVGAFGETMVVDWGLACELDGDQDQPSPTRRPRPVGGALAAHTWRPLDADATVPTAGPGHAGGAANPALTRPGEVFGTPAYMSPEQARGERLTPASDVFSLGATLHAMLTGRSPRPDNDPAAPIQPLAEACPEAPAELVAIAARALADAPEDRYADAGALVADIEAWFEGRRVLAYDYSTWDLARRALRAWRLPLAIAGVAVVAVAAAVAVGFARTSAERNRAQEAEAAAVLARDQSDQHLAGSLVAQARAAAAADRQAQAELLAATALTLREDPVARGVLARFGGRERPQSVASVPLPRCDEVVVDAEGQAVACVRSTEVLVLRADGSTRERLPIEAVDLAFAGSEELAVLEGDGRVTAWRSGEAQGRPLGKPPLESDLLTGPRTGQVLVTGRGTLSDLSLEDGSWRDRGRCPSSEGLHGIDQAADGRLALVCGSGRVLVSAGAGAPLREAPVGLAGAGLPTRLAWSTSDPDQLAIGFESGRVEVVALDGPGPPRVARGSGPVRDLALHGARLAVAGADGDVTAWDLDAGLAIARLPSGPARVRWQADGEVLRVISDRIEDWRLPAAPPPAVLDAGGGVAAVALSGDGATLAAALGTGEVRLWRRADGVLLATERWQDGVVKDVGFSPDGTQLAAATAGAAQVRIFDLAGGAAHRDFGSNKHRRVAWLRPDLLVAASYGPELQVLAEGRTQVLPLSVRVGDMEADPDGGAATVLDQDGRIWRLDVGLALRQVGQQRKATAVAGDSDGTFVTLAQALLELDGQGGVLRRVEVEAAKIVDLAISPDGHLLALGHADGTATVLSRQHLAVIARLEGHSHRVAAVNFDATGRWLLTGSWDGRVRAWHMGSLEAEAGTLAEALSTSWGRRLDDLLQE